MILLRTVGPGGSPNENGETTIDALVMDGVSTILVFDVFAIHCCSLYCSMFPGAQ